MRPRVLIVAVFGALVSAHVSRAAPPREVTVAASRVHLGDVVPGLGPEASAVDLGAAPGAGATRLIVRAEISAALRERDLAVPPSLPAAIRVTRKTRRLDAAAVQRMVREGLAELPRGVMLRQVRATPSVSVPDGWTRLTVEMPRPPRRIGAASTVATLTFFEAEQVTATLSVPIELALDSHAAIPDVGRGSRITLVVRHGLVEVSALGSTAADANIGEVVPVVIRPSGRTLLARVEDQGHAVWVETP